MSHAATTEHREAVYMTTNNWHVTIGDAWEYAQKSAIEVDVQALAKIADGLMSLTLAVSTARGVRKQKDFCLARAMQTITDFKASQRVHKWL